MACLDQLAVERLKLVFAQEGIHQTRSEVSKSYFRSAWRVSKSVRSLKSGAILRLEPLYRALQVSVEVDGNLVATSDDPIILELPRGNSTRPEGNVLSAY